MDLVGMVRAADTVRQSLDMLPPTVNGIADAMHTADIKGRVGCPEECPLALYVDKALSGAGVDEYIVSVHSDNIALDYCESETFGFHFPTPPLVAEFVKAFDCGSFPDLIHDPEPGWL